MNVISYYVYQDVYHEDLGCCHQKMNGSILCMLRGPRAIKDHPQVLTVDTHGHAWAPSRWADR